MRIEAMTPEQEAMLPLWRARYLERGTATGPCDRPAIEAAIARLYESRSYKAPEHIIWMDSPLGGVLAAGGLAGVIKGGQLRDQLRDQLSDQLSDQLGDQLSDQLRGQLRGQLGGQLWDQLWDQLGGQLRGQLGGQLYRSGYGQQDGYWVGWLTFGRYLGATLEPSGGLDALDALCDAGWWWPFEGAVVLTDRPTDLHRDERGRLHNETGPAMAYADGYTLYAWHGVRVEAEVIETPAEQITAERITNEANAEVRRVLIERVGYERYIAIAGATKVSRDDWGTLWRVARPDDSPLMLVEVVNSTPEPDGSSKRYFLRVPGVAKESQPARSCLVGGEDIRGIPRTPRQALGWMARLCSEHYVLAAQS